MEHRGIRYAIKVGITRGQWCVAIHRPGDDLPTERTLVLSNGLFLTRNAALDSHETARGCLFSWHELEGSMHPTEQPADSERGYNGRIRLRFNFVAQPCLYRACILPHNIGSLAVEVLSGPCCLIHGFGVAGSPADTS